PVIVPITFATHFTNIALLHIECIMQTKTCIMIACMPMCLLMKLGFIKPGLLRFMKSLAYKSCAIGRAVKNHPPEANLDAWLIHLEFWRREQTRLVIKDRVGSFSDESGASSWY